MIIISSVHAVIARQALGKSRRRRRRMTKRRRRPIMVPRAAPAQAAGSQK